MLWNLGGRDDYLFWMNAQNIFFQLPKLNKYYLGAELAAAPQVIKKLKMDHLWAYKQSHFMMQWLQSVIKKKNKKGMPVTEILNTCTRQRDNDLLEI